MVPVGGAEVETFPDDPAVMDASHQAMPYDDAAEKQAPSSRPLSGTMSGTRAASLASEQTFKDEKGSSRKGSKPDFRPATAPAIFAPLEEPQGLGLDPKEAWNLLQKELIERYFDDDSLSSFKPDDLQEAVFTYDQYKGTLPNAELNSLIQDINPELSLDLIKKEWEDLTADKKEIVDCIHDMLASISGGSKPAFSRFKMGGTGPIREVLLIPKGLEVAPKTVKHLLGKKMWNLEAPDQVVKFDFGTKHMSSLTTPELVELPAFEALKDATESAISRQLNRSNSLSPEDKGDKGVRTRRVKKLLDNFMKDLLMEATLAILTASFMSQSWVLIDRSHATKSSPTAELCLETCLSTMSRPPVVLVQDSVTRFAAFKPSRTNIKQLMVIASIVANASSGDEMPDPVSLEEHYKLSDFENWEQFHLRDPTATNYPEEDEGNRRLPRQPEQQMIAVDDNMRPMKTSDGRPLITAQVKWVYFFRQYLFQQGSHYIIHEDAATSSLPMRTSSSAVDWAEAHIYAHGGNLSFERLQDAFKKGIPAVLLYNTGGVTQTFASIHRWCVTNKMLLQNFENPTKDVVEQLEVVSSEPWTRSIGPSLVETMQRLEARAPEKLRRAYAIVDVLTDSAETMVEKVTECFASGGVGLPELGLGSAETDILLIAWHSCMVFDRAAQRFKWKGEFMYYLTISLALLSGLLAILTSVYKEELQQQSLHGLISSAGAGVLQDVAGRPLFDYMDSALLVLPIVSTLLATVTSKRRHLNKWAVLHSVSRQIVTQIYKFRTRTGEYDMASVPSAQATDDEDEDAKDGAGAGPGTSPREIFVARYSLLYNYALSNVGEDTIKDTATFDLTDPEFRTELQQRLKKFVQTNLLKGSSPNESIISRCSRWFSCSCRRKKKYSIASTKVLPFTSVMPQATLGGLSTLTQQDNGLSKRTATPPDDYLSPMTVESYIEHRLKPLFIICKKKTPVLSCSLTLFETLLVLLNSFATFLTAVDLKVWVSMTVILVTATQNTLQHQLIQQRLTAENDAIRCLDAIAALMAGQSVIQRRTRKMKGLCVHTVESAVLATSTAWTGVAEVLHVTSSGGNDQEGDEK
mmetsp:Transcript_49993/g.89748  ORF Transcript_49993/g.89748 Transcript_49993/m.89748 type:complete len:1089 (+) Transcript_49993:33-3299(+)|eukprot:CAMPEP_0197643920 /NCGR_PEP_ID=MMETSP1338-20131121/17070_1 /TAXON_ID=43686 ORGANISM="Pelagodinium beii, Strain RCC1491" /NCGR_SAMPLE_ID=MMETSP1338 /ASSEMBLY_ACC=CAM_ASM_000754 /LENGTH=1088 /DNA_ID=CAMNT_0043217229 /DNA_START=24 /DNA_END=3290 /DNA_ORIENTATION=-